MLSRFCAASKEPDGGADLPKYEIMTRGEMKSWILTWLSHSCAPQVQAFSCLLENYCFIPGHSSERSF